MTDQPEFLSLAQALCQAGKLAYVRIGIGRGTIRVKPAALEALLREGRKERKPEPGRMTLEDALRAVGGEGTLKRRKGRGS